MWPIINTSTNTSPRPPSSPSLRPNTSSSNGSPATLAPTTVKPLSPAGKTLTEALRRNPFRLNSKSADGNNGTIRSKEEETRSLNADLKTLVEFFPDVKIEVFREMLLRFDGDSRLMICMDQLHRYKNEWAKGRMEVPSREWTEDSMVPEEERFRQPNYVKTVEKTLSAEFKSLSRSAIGAVLAEVNFSYTRARPVLQALNTKSWRFAIGNIFRKKNSKEEPPAFLFDRVSIGHDSNMYVLLSTGCNELDLELREIFLNPQRLRLLEDQLDKDYKYAVYLNATEAEKEKALFECQVCYNEMPFENVSSCTSGNHIVCLDCVRKTIHEAVFGQGWNKSVDLKKGSLRCLADIECEAHITHSSVQRAFLDDKSGPEIWSKFEERLAEHTVFASNIGLVRCPFCSYAESDRIYTLGTARRDLHWRLQNPSTMNPFAFIFVLGLFVWLLFVVQLLSFFGLQPAKVRFYMSLANSAQQHRTSRFSCQNPKCRRKSCLKCTKAWHDPHTCHEPLITSLRTTIEAARTAAIKRTCPRCGTSFVKSSGCNKLVCVCGYAMCYLCRKNIGKVGPGAIGGGGGGGFLAGNIYNVPENNHNINAADQGAELGGYRHFCEHFRPIPGQACTQCDKCDLYRSEDEDKVVKRAGQEAERLWREKEGVVDVKGLEEALEKVAVSDTNGFGTSSHFFYLFNSLSPWNWNLQRGVDWFVGTVLVVSED